MNDDLELSRFSSDCEGSAARECAWTEAAICISPKKMASCNIYSFVMFFYLFAMFSQLANLLLTDVVSQYLALTKQLEDIWYIVEINVMVYLKCY